MNLLTPVTPTRVNLNFDGDGLACTSGKVIGLIKVSPKLLISDQNKNILF
jgi:hypothetical protein